MANALEKILSTISQLKFLLQRWVELRPRLEADCDTLRWLHHENQVAQRAIEQMVSRSASCADARDLGKWLLHIENDSEEVGRRVQEYERLIRELRVDAEAVAAYAERENINAGPLLMVADNLSEWHPAEVDAAWEVIRRVEVRALNASIERLLFDPATQTVTLDGHAYPKLDPTAFRILEEIWRGEGRPVSSQHLSNLPGLKSKNIDRELKKLPKELQAIIQSSPGSGRWISLPTQNCL